MDCDSDNIKEELYEPELIQKTGDELLLDLIRNYPVIYDKDLSEHKNQAIVNNAWEDIALVISLPAKECQTRFRRLKQNYSRERLKREQEARNGAGASTRKGWELYENMSFLEKHLIRRKSFGCYYTTGKKLDPIEIEQNKGGGTVILNFSEEDSGEKKEEKDNEQEKKKDEAKPTKEKAEYFIEPMKRKIDPLEETFQKMNTAIEALVHNLSNSGNDAEDLFGKLIACELKRKPKEERNLIKRKILELIY